MTTYEKWRFSSDYSLPSYYWNTSYTLQQFYPRENSELCTCHYYFLTGSNSCRHAKGSGRQFPVHM